MVQKVINFGAGPAKLPEQVLQQVKSEIIEYGNCGISVMEMSHRTKDYDSLHNAAINNLRQLLNVPENYKVLLLSGGATQQFAAVCMNLIGKTGKADYIVTGAWSSKAAKEATKYGKINLVLPKTTKYTTIPKQSTWNLDPNASFVYYCDNETIDGVEFDFIPETNGVPVVCDMSSNILSREFDVSKFGVVFACAQKNIGPSGATVVIVRDDLIGNPIPTTPTVMDYAVMAKDNSNHNTPPVYNIYVMGLAFKWIQEKGGIKEMERLASIKSKLIYETIDNSEGFYYAPVDQNLRSKMNIPFRVGGADGNSALEKEFLKGAESKGMVQLSGHRSVGGIRASLYNAITIEETEVLKKYMLEFSKQHFKN